MTALLEYFDSYIAQKVERPHPISIANSMCMHAHKNKTFSFHYYYKVLVVKSSGIGLGGSIAKVWVPEVLPGFTYYTSCSETQISQVLDYLNDNIFVQF